ncbi:hypothetical protein BOTBODRAFT_33408 [Botryobasidium botryosum FD-172 SS1]|uniref:Pre-mRNA-processing factor 19 n=1 Tax=Botryobasidium botryosum (strain FD-172 SS1) TaxID=930990 RepID=A0A067MP94_BOTB1|nr:hypothetical protein BOTBODRAFT_33408 [Botryobasidium botryosum FD-172 SS1]
MFFCAISGEPPQDPVVSSKSGHVYERRLITKYITDNGTDPITGEKLDETDLISIKANPATAPPRPPTLTSIPALLHTLQNEWDALVLETFALKQQYNSARQELSHALYQHDAATRVVARLMRERDAAREALASVQATMGVAPQPTAVASDVEMVDESAEAGGLPEDVTELIEQTHKTLSATRKKRKVPSTYTTPSQLRAFTSKHTIPSLHASSPAGINTLALSKLNPSQFLTGGNDKIVQLYDRDSGKVLATLKGHTKKVNHVEFREKEGESTLLLSGSADKTVRIWSHDADSGEYAPQQTVKIHKGEITGLAVHPTSTILALSSMDKTYSLHSLSTFQPIFHAPATTDVYTSLSIHPDGTLLALGTSSSTLQIYDIRTGAIAASLTSGDGANPFSVHTSSFSENGYHLAASEGDAAVAIWDLRKLKSVHSIGLDEGYKISRVRYDPSAQFLGVAGSTDVRVFLNKSWEELVKFDGSAVADLAFGEDGKELWGVGGREVRIWAAKDE